MDSKTNQILAMKKGIEALLLELDKRKFLNGGLSEEVVGKVVKNVMDSIVKGASEKVIISFLKDIIDEEYFKDKESAPSILAKLLTIKNDSTGLSEQVEMSRYRVLFNKALHRGHGVKPKKTHKEESFKLIKDGSQHGRLMFALLALSGALMAGFIFVAHKKNQLNFDTKIDGMQHLSLKEAEMLDQTNGINGKKVAVYCHLREQPSSIHSDEYIIRALNLNSLVESRRDWRNKYELTNEVLAGGSCIIEFDPSSDRPHVFHTMLNDYNAMDSNTEERALKEIVTDEDFNQMLRSSRDSVLLFYKDSCPTCTKISPIFNTYAKKSPSKDCYLVRCNYEDAKSREFLSEYIDQVKFAQDLIFPTTIFIGKGNGKKHRPQKEARSPWFKMLNNSSVEPVRIFIGLKSCSGELEKE